ncbi:MAG TPA: HAMP domain-containing sensor histidine kinase [Bacteriovoracaceae bacterium]|nr:HAMP domain-containing sensor histidine kinase [Bacteriovoracaceae bacterium]
MPNKASERLKKLNVKIMSAWEVRVLEEIDAAAHQKSLALQDSLPEFLNQISDALSTTIDRTQARIRWDLKESTRIGKKHGDDRAGCKNYTMDQLIFEYHILRQVICDVMEEEATLSDIEREVITCAVEQAVNDAATQYSDTLRDIQEKFTHTLTHDLRGPISSAKMSAQIMIKKTDREDPNVSLARRISSSMDRVDIMINDLLDAGQLRAGQQLNLDFLDCDLDTILGQVAEEANLLHENRLKWKSIGPVLGHWNENALRRVVDNLVTNALKYSEPGTPIDIDLKKDDKTVEVSVHNIGKPISPEEQPILFQQYRRLRTAESKKGWGLGLTVVKGLTEAHGGHVEVESTAEFGTTFKVVLPLAAYTPAASEHQENIKS